MGASILAYWPGIGEDQLESQPGFYNDYGPWASWTVRRQVESKVAQQLKALNLEVLDTFTTEGVDENQVAWASPSVLKEAALRLRELVLAGRPETEVLLRSYEEGAVGAGPVREEFAQDLSDIAALADFAEREGVRLMTLKIDW